MSTETIYVRGSREQIVHAVYRAVGDACTGGSSAAEDVAKRCGNEALALIRAAFIVKSHGGTDEAGEKWQKLSPKTIAYRRARGRRSKAEQSRESHPSQALNTTQQQRWWEVYRRQLAKFKGDKAHAAAVAWLVLKQEGATTLVDKYGGEDVDILQDTRDLLNSLSPDSQSPNQIFRLSPGEVELGTVREGAADHHSGIPGRLPQRRLWPSPGRWPSSWWNRLLEQARHGLVKLVVSYIKEST